MHFRTFADLPTLAAAAALLAIGACGQNGSSSNIAAVTGTGAGNQVAALDEGQRNAVFIRAIRDAGEDCQHVQSSRPAGRYRGMPVWSATCRGGGHWTIVVADNGVAQILNAAEARLITDRPEGAAANRSAD